MGQQVSVFLAKYLTLQAVVIGYPPLGGWASDVSAVTHKSHNWADVMSGGPKAWGNSTQHSWPSTQPYRLW